MKLNSEFNDALRNGLSYETFVCSTNYRYNYMMNV